MVFNRDSFLSKLEQVDIWDVIVIGGGATGLGTALDAASRGYKTLLLEQADFAKGTSSRSTKLVHGGVRYLAQGDVGLVYEALRERGTLLVNAPHLVKSQQFIIPCYDWKSVLMYIVGLKLYDWLAGKFSFGRSKYLSSNSVAKAIPSIKGQMLIGGISYYDGQFDDARLAINIAQTCAEHGGTLLNYFKVTGLIKEEGRVRGVEAVDVESDRAYTLRGKIVINATGVFVDEILQLDKPTGQPTVRPSQGAHIVLDKSFLEGHTAMMIPKTSDGRVLFAVPWHNHVVVGTTDTPLNEQSLEPIALSEEIDFILSTAGKYLNRAPERKDILSIFAGLRPLAAPHKDQDKDSTKEISRSHKIMVTPSCLITIIGGKWTTYRKMAEETVDKAIKIASLPPARCKTKSLRIHGCVQHPSGTPFEVYGSDEDKIKLLINENPHLGLPLASGFPYTFAEVVWAVRYEMARSVEDVLARRLRLLFLDAKSAIDAAPQVARLIASELSYDKEWQNDQVRKFRKIANKYLPEPYMPEIEESIHK